MAPPAAVSGADQRPSLASDVKNVENTVAGGGSRATEAPHHHYENKEQGPLPAARLGPGRVNWMPIVNKARRPATFSSTTLSPFPSHPRRHQKGFPPPLLSVLLPRPPPSKSPSDASSSSSSSSTPLQHIPTVLHYLFASFPVHQFPVPPSHVSDETYHGRAFTHDLELQRRILLPRPRLLLEDVPGHQLLPIAGAARPSARPDPADMMDGLDLDSTRPHEPSSSMRCCCGRSDCAFLRKNSSVLESVEKDVHTAAQLGQVRYVCGRPAPGLSPSPPAFQSDET